MIRANRPLLVGLLTLLAGLLASGAAGWWQTHHNDADARARFADLADGVVDRVTDRFRVYEYGLRGARGLVAANEGRITREGFLRYSATRDVDKEFFGARGFGLIWRVAEADEAEFTAAARRDDWPEFSIRQLAPHRGERFVIQYIEPVQRNRAAVGLDVASERNRREAALAASRTGAATLTEPITLVQATGKPSRSFLLLLPIYRPGPMPQTAAERVAATIGWSYAPLVIDEVLSHLDSEAGLYTLSLRDTGSADGHMFFSLPNAEAAEPPGLTRQIPIEIYGRTWEAEVSATPEFMRSLGHPSPGRTSALVALIGLLCAALASVATQLAVRARQQRIEQARRASIVAASDDAIIGVTLEGVVTDWNAGAERLFGHSAAEAVGRRVVELIVPGELIGEEVTICDAVSRGLRQSPFETIRRHRSGELIDVSISAAPIVAASGECIGYSKSLRDIRESRRARQELAALNASLEAQVAERTAMLDTAMHDLRAILDAVPSMIGYWDRDLVNRMANRAYAQWLDIEPGALQGRSMPEVLGRQWLEEDRAPVEAALRGEPQTFERTIPSPDGSGVRHLLAHYLPDAVDGEVRGFYVLLHDVSELASSRQSLAAAMRDNEALLGTIHQHFIVSIADRNGRIVDVNPAFCAISGYGRDELVGQDHRIVNSGHHDRDFWVGLWGTIARGTSWHGDVCNRAKDGSLYWVNSVVAPFLGPDGTIEKYISIRTDITPVKRAQEEAERARRDAEAAERFLREVTDKLPLRISYVDENLRFRFVNQAQCQRFGLSREQILGRTRDEVTGTETPSLTTEHVRRVLRGMPGTYEAEERGRTFEVRLVPDSGPDGRAVGFFAVGADISDRKRSENELRRTLTLLKSVLEASTQVAIIAVEPDGLISLFNRGAEQLLGYRSEEVIGRVSSLKFHDPEEMRRHAEALTRELGRKVHTGMALIEPETLNQPHPWTYLHRDGRRITVSLAVTAMRDDRGELVGYLGVAHDIGERIRQEASLRHALQKAQSASLAKSQFLANMSHEIRTPMNAVIGLSYLLARTSLDREQMDMLAKIRLASQSLLAIINDVLDLSKIEASEMHIERAPFMLPGLLEELVGLSRLQADAKGVALEVELAPDLPRAVEGDATRLRQVLSNLLSNAVKFTERGAVRLSVRTLGSVGDRVSLRFDIQDTGIGIAPEVLPKLFAPFVQADASTTRRFGGTGLGLSIVRQLVSLMGGRVGVDSTPRLGSTFRVELELPVCDAAAVAIEAQADSEPAGLSGVRVLITDDSPINLEVARRILEREGAQVSLASNGQEAVDQLLSEPGGLDVILMDVQMPVLDGHDATRLIRIGLGLKRLPIIALTAGITTGEHERARAAGMNDVVSKPFDPPELVRVIRRHLAVEDSIEASPPPRAEILDAWPRIDGIDTHDVGARLGGDSGLFHSLLRRLLDDFSDLGGSPDASDRAVLAARLHNLKGSAGTLGARSIAALAAQGEEFCRAHDAQNTVRTLRQLAAELDALRQHAMPWLQEQDDDMPEPGPGTLDAAAVKELLEQLRRSDLAALDRFQRLAPQLRGLLGSRDFSRVRQQMDNLRFAEAASALERMAER